MRKLGNIKSETVKHCCARKIKYKVKFNLIDNKKEYGYA